MHEKITRFVRAGGASSFPNHLGVAKGQLACCHMPFMSSKRDSAESLLSRAAQHLMGSPKRDDGSRTPPRNEDEGKISSRVERVDRVDQGAGAQGAQGAQGEVGSFMVENVLRGLITDMLGNITPYQQDKEIVQVRRSGSLYRRLDDLNKYTIFHEIPFSLKEKLVHLGVREDLMNRAMGSMLGMAVGDSLGHPFEFLPVQDRPVGPHFDPKSFEFVDASNAFQLKRGQWTDDAAMGLCMADSLILKRDFDGSDMRVRFWCWWNRGYNNAFRKDPSRSSSAGLGGNIAKSLTDLSHLLPGELPPPAYKAATEDAGNGSLMRFTPIAIYFHAHPVDELLHFARLSSYTTHPGIIAAEACSLLAFLIMRALTRSAESSMSSKDFLDKTTQEYLKISGLEKKSGWGYDQMNWLVKSKPVNPTERCWDWRSSDLDIAGTLRARGRTYNGYPVSSGYFGSYSLDGMALALWAFYHTSSFDEAVVKSVNLLGDADSHGSITGQLAGAFYGYSSISPKFVEWVTRWDDHEFACRGALLVHLGGAAAEAAGPRITSL